MNSEKKIFEHVPDPVRSSESGSGGRPSRGQKTGRDRNMVAWWLLLLILLVIGTILIGGMTRLTDSGLSITEWSPISGVIPPMTAEDWSQEFEKYKLIPEFTLQNASMNLAEFKSIYWWEWSHRMIARLLGVVWLTGFAWLLVRGNLNRNWKIRSSQIGILIIVQGVLGWWMVSSGLSGRNVDVAAYRLAIHSTLAFAILALVAWSYWLARMQPVELLQATRRRNGRISLYSAVFVTIMLLQVFLGGLVAGLDAGRGYVDWPLMNGQFLPDESFDYSPFWINFFENAALTQFNHRLTAYLILGFSVFFWLRCRRTSMVSIRNWSALVIVVVLCQALAGIVTLFEQASSHTAILHQAGAVATFLFIVRLRLLAMFPPDDRIGGE